MQRKMGVILNRTTGENVTVLLPRYHASYLLSPMNAEPYGFGLHPPPPPLPSFFPTTLQGTQSLTFTTTQCYLFASKTTSWGYYGFLAFQDQEYYRGGSRGRVQGVRTLH